MSSVIILQRVVPHYRVPLFRRLYSEFGWPVVTARQPPKGSHLELVEDEAFIRPFELEFPDPDNLYRVNVPVGQILRDTKAEAVIAEFSLRMTSSYYLLARRRLRSAPITVFWSHGYNMERGLAGLKPWLYQLPRIGLLKLADAHLCYSEEGVEFLSRFFPRDRLFLVPNTLDLAPMRELAKRIGHVEPPGMPHLLTIGRMLPDKNFPMLIKVFKQFRKSFPDAKLTIIGDGPAMAQVREAAGPDAAESVRLAGREYQEENLARYFLSADLVVFPGAVGLSVNHALSYGIPVMAFDRVPGGPKHHPEIAYVRDGVTGHRIPDFSEDALLRALIDFFCRYGSPRSHFAEPIRQFADREMTLARMIAGFAQLRSFLRQSGIDA